MNKSIYIVEDNDDIRELIEYLLDNENYHVTGFANVTDFKDQLSKTRPHLIILDVMLPDGNGMQVANELKSEEGMQQIPILLMSANTNVAYISAESKADDFISKPFDIDDLITRVAKMINK